MNDRDDVGAAFDRLWATDLGIPNGLGRHDNDGMFGFYLQTPAGFQIEVGHGARVITEAGTTTGPTTRSAPGVTLTVDVILDEPRAFDPINVQVCDPERPTTAVSGGPGRRRWEFMRLPTEMIDDLNREERAWELLASYDEERGPAPTPPSTSPSSSAGSPACPTRPRPPPARRPSIADSPLVVPEMVDWFGRHDVRWALQRPDFHLFGTAADTADRLLADLRRQIRRTP